MSAWIVPEGVTTGNDWVVAYEDGEAIGYAYIPDFSEHGPDTMVGVRMCNGRKVTWRVVSRAELETFREFKLFPRLKHYRTVDTTIKTMGSGDVMAFQLAYRLPTEKPDADADSERTITVPGDVLTRAYQAAAFFKKQQDDDDE